MRFLSNDKNLTFSFKRLRHQVNKILSEEPLFSKGKLLSYRNAKYDVGRNLTIKNDKKDILDIFLANIQRVEEALRVLEEFSKLFNSVTEEKFRKLRFRTYHWEKRAFKVIEKYVHK
ncbi:MAG: hypothetical protein ACK4NT_07135 [Candidatus Omnitrophota bacterium]